jgi:hypothetical protein
MSNIMQETPTADMTSKDEYPRVVWRHLIPILDGEREHATEYLPGSLAGAGAGADTAVQQRVWLSSHVMTAARA